MPLAASSPLLPVALAVVALVVLFAVQAAMESRSETARQALRKTGEPVLAVLVMANSEFLASQEIPEAPALVAFSFERPSPELANALRELGRRAFALYVATGPIPGGPADQAVAKFMKSDRHQPDRRFRLPDAFTGGREVYLAHVMLTRRELPLDLGSNRLLPCAVSGRDQGQIEPLGLSDRATSLILERAGG